MTNATETAVRQPEAQAASGTTRVHDIPGARGLLPRALSLISLLAFWTLLSLLLSADVMPTPWRTAAVIVEEFERGRLLGHVAITMQRVVLSFLFAMALGIAAGGAMGASRFLNQLLEVWLVTGLAIPRIVLIVAAYLLIGLNETAAVIAITLTVAPTVAAQVREGIRAIDYRYVEMARAYRRRTSTIWWRVVMPQVLPHILGASRGAMSLTWKMVVFAELMGRTSGVGYQISFFFQMFHMEGILAYAAVMVVLLAIVDQGLLQAVERLGFRWRRPGQLAGRAE